LASKTVELERIFDLLLFLLSVITAVLFQYVSTTEPLRIVASKPNLSQTEPFQEVDKNLTLYLRVLFIPFFLLVAVWISNRLSLKTRIVSRKNFSEFCYAFGFTNLVFNIYFFVLMSFPGLAALGNPVLVTALISQFVITFPFIYYHEIPLIDQTDARTRMQKYNLIWKPILSKTYLVSFAAWIIFIIIFVANPIPYVSS
jgi:uncharacterized membrane protein YozB (DUF420 family)